MRKAIYLFILFTCVTFFDTHAQKKEYKTKIVSGFKQRGSISYYIDRFEGRRLASGETLDNSEFVASHHSIPFDTKVKVTNLANGKSVIVRVNDRGPYAHGRIMDVSKAAAIALGLTATGVSNAEIEVINPDGTVPSELAEKEDNLDEEDDDIDDGYVPLAKNSSITKSYQANKIYSEWGTVRRPEGYGIQLGGFNDFENAKKYCKKIRNNGLKKNELIFIRVKLLNNKKWFQIIGGKYNSKADAESNINYFKKYTGQTGFATKY